MGNMKTILLCAGPLNISNLPTGGKQSNAMIPVNGKPVIGWILDDLLAKGIMAATVVLRAEDERLRRFLRWAYAERMAIKTLPLVEPDTILHSLQAGLGSHPAGPVRIVLGDTLIRDPFTGTEDFVYTGRVEDSRRWCLVVTDSASIIQEYIDKQENVTEPHQALAGYYHLQDGALLASCVQRSLAARQRELSSALRHYGASRPIQTRSVQEWFDFGHIDNLVHARRSLLRPRHFNTLTINPMLNTITKFSEHGDKLQNELDWYLHIPDELKVLTPRIVNHRQVDGRLQMVQEYYGYPSLAELYVYGDLHSDTWVSILHHVMRVHQAFGQHSDRLSTDDIAAMYIEKTWRRLDLLESQDPGWSKLLAQETIQFNGQSLASVRSLAPAIDQYAEKLIETAQVSIIHGDFCFSNILFDVHHQIIRLVDPRGSFGRPGIYGDGRYDIAKLRHSVAGLYDFIVADMFRLERQGNGFHGRIYANGAPQQVRQTLDGLIAAAGYDLSEIRFIEGLLFISMLPLHSDTLRRQQMMYLIGLTRLNEVLHAHRD
jgi:dTDP-glucose pyrophosphorylase